MSTGQIEALSQAGRRDRLRELLREVMVRNTRAHIDLKLPKRLAATHVVQPTPEEANVLNALAAVIRDRYTTATAADRWRMMTLQMQAGSGPAALRFGLRDHRGQPDVEPFAATAAALDRIGSGRSAKVEALQDLARRSPEKKIVFTRFRATLDELEAALTVAGHRVSVFHGGLSSVDKQRAIDAFENDAEILLSTEVGGQGRNLQFCRTVINYDLPWNPVTIEQRVGRVHRIGQTRDVYIFNLCLAGSVEERILSILHDKINMFELVAGEVEMILGHLGDDQDFASLVMEAWSSSRDGEDSHETFARLSARLLDAKSAYQKTSDLDRALFSEDYEISTLIGRLTADLLTRGGAIVDSGPGPALEVMAEPALRLAIGLGEFERLAFEPGVAGATFIDYDAPLVDRLAAVVNGLGRVARAQPPSFMRKPIDAAAMIDRGLTIHNGVHRYHSHAAVDTTYVGVAFEYTVLADERMGGVVTTWVNPATRSTASFESRIDVTSLPDDAEAARSDPMEGSGAAWPLAVASARAQIAPEIADFLERLRRRRDRDVRRLREYYEEIDREIRSKLSRPRLNDDQRRRERDRLDATHRACRSRGVEVADRYRVRLRLAPIGVWLCEVPAHHIKVKLMRRNASADAVFSWNPIDGRLEPRACDGCLAPTESAWLCDDAVHYVCGDCLAPCRQCGRRFCRACTRECPRPHARE